MNEKTTAPVPWNDLEAFLAVADAGGLSAAARKIGASAPTLGRRMRALERALGRDLFERKSHGYDLTAAGLALRQDLAPVAGRIARATARLAGDELPLIRVSAGYWTARRLVQHLPVLAGEPPDLRFRFIAAAETLSINRREAVIGIRNRRPSEAGLATRRLAPIEFAAFATPTAPDGWLRVTAQAPSSRWLTEEHAQHILHEVNAPQLALDMARAGAGRVVLPTFVGDEIAGLERIGPPIAALFHDQWLVTHDDDRALPEVRRAIDRITGVLRAFA